MQMALCAYLEPRYDKTEILTIYWNHDETRARDDTLRAFLARCPRLSTLIIKRHVASRALAKASLSGTCGQRITALHLPLYISPCDPGFRNKKVECSGFVRGNQRNVITTSSSRGGNQHYSSPADEHFHLLVAALAAGGLPALKTLSLSVPLPPSHFPLAIISRHADAIASMLKVRHAWGYAGLAHFPSLHHILEELDEYGWHLRHYSN
jgi:hypothetical protein